MAAAEDELRQAGLLFIDCSCLDVEKCSKCRSERRKETEPLRQEEALSFS